MTTPLIIMAVSAFCLYMLEPLREMAFKEVDQGAHSSQVLAPLMAMFFILNFFLTYVLLH